MKRTEEIRKAIKQRSDRRRHTIYVSDSLFQKVKVEFKDVSINKVIEQLLREALGDKRTA